jgi:hypothetical protein
MKFMMMFNELSKEDYKKVVSTMPGKPFYSEQGENIGTIINAYEVGPEDMNTADIHVELNDLGKQRYIFFPERQSVTIKEVKNQ